MTTSRVIVRFLRAFAAASVVLIGSGMGFFTSLLICRAENRDRYPATCPAVDHHSGLLFSAMVLTPTVLVAGLGIGQVRARPTVVLACATLALWLSYVVSLFLT
jgi:hypothetical protein